MSPSSSSYDARLRAQYRDARNLNARIELHRRFSTNPYGWTRWVFDQMLLAAGPRVLELGCGTGLLWKVNARRVAATWRITLGDFSIGMLREARSNLDELHARLRFVQLDAQALPFIECSFDAVVANHMLYHVADRDWAISEIHRVLKPGGKLYAATNGRTHLTELHQIIERFMPGRGIADHVDRFGLETGEPQLRRHFPDVELRRYQDSLKVTEAQPLVDYAASSIRGIAEDVLAAMHLDLQEQLDTHGSIRITKDAGLLISGK